MTYNPAISYTTAHATIACRGYGDNDDGFIHGHGTYASKAYTAKVTTICSVNGVTLREVVDATTKYEIYWDGELIDRYTKRETAINYCADFAGITSRALAKLIRG